jgi:hypothetical protein
MTKQQLNKNTNHTIYECLSSSFWTERKCWACQQRFTKQDYQQKNYQFTFQEILNVWESKDFPEPRDNACLEGVIVKLFHQTCQKVNFHITDCHLATAQDTTDE